MARDNLNVRKGWTLIDIKSLASEAAYDAIIDDLGRILVVGGTQTSTGFAGDLLVIRCRPDGLLDQGFSDGGGSPGGVVVTPVPHGQGHASACLCNSGNNTLTVAAGCAFGSHGTGFVLVRYRVQ